MPSDPKKAAKRYLAVDIHEEDFVYARTQDRWGCAVVRAIQRELPDALRVRVDSEEIAFSLPDDDTRYFFRTPPDVVTNIVRPFDEGVDWAHLAQKSFVLDAAFAAEPITHRNRAEMIKNRNMMRRTRRKAPLRTGRGSGAVRTFNRFLDLTAGLEEEDDAE